MNQYTTQLSISFPLKIRIKQSEKRLSREKTEIKAYEKHGETRRLKYLKFIYME